MGEKKRNRRAYTANQRRNLIDRFDTSGITAREFCRLNTLSERTLRYWRQLTRERQSDGGKSPAGTDTSGGNAKPADRERQGPKPAAPVAFSWSLSRP